MTLSKSKLKSALKAISVDVSRAPDDEDSVWFDADAVPPRAILTTPAAAALWADAMADYAGDVTQGGSGAAFGRDALASSLATAFGLPAAAAAMELAFTTFAGALATGMASSTPVSFTATPPPGPVGFATLFTSPTDSAEDAATAISDAIHTWMKTGSATPNTPPGAGSSLWA